MKRRVARKIFFWFIVIVTLFLGACSAFFVLAGDLLKHIAIVQISHLTNTRITTESVDISLNGSILIKNISISPQQARVYDDTILKAEMVHTRFSVGSLLMFHPTLKKISIRNFVFNAQYDSDSGQWNLSEVKIEMPSGGGGDGGSSRGIPAINLNHGVLQYSKVVNNKVQIISSVPIEAEMKPQKNIKGSYSFVLETARRDIYRRSVLKGNWKPGIITFAGGISADELPIFKKSWVIDTMGGEFTYDKDSNFSMQLEVKNFVNGREADKKDVLRKSQPSNALDTFSEQTAVFGKFDISLKASGNLKDLKNSRLAGQILCKDISILTSQFPYLIENMSGPINFTQQEVVLNGLKGRHKDVNLVINGFFRNFGENVDSKLQVTSDNMILDQDLYEALTPSQQKLFKAFSPVGVTGINFSFTQRPGEGKKYKLDVNLLKVDSAYELFPYPLSDVKGSLIFDENSIDVKALTSQKDSRKIVINGRITGTDTYHPKFNLVIDVNNIPLDSTLGAALPEMQRNLYHQFEMNGAGTGKINVYTKEKDPNSADFAADLHFKNISVLPKKFPILISDINANIIFTPDSINFKNFAGRIGTEGEISLKGQVWLDILKNHLRLDLAANGKKAELTEEVLNAIPGKMKKTVERLHPTGTVDFAAKLTKSFDSKSPDYELAINFRDNTLTPVSFPYPLKDIKGNLIITSQKLRLDNITAKPANTVLMEPNVPIIAIDGTIDIADQNLGTAELKIAAENIPFDQQLYLVLPKDIQNLYSTVSPVGKFDLALKKMRISDSNDGQKRIDANGQVKFKKCAFKNTSDLSSLNGKLIFKGLYKTQKGLEDANMVFYADTIRIKEKLLTNFAADINYDPNGNRWLNRNFIGDFYGGKITGKFEFKKSPDQSDCSYQLQTAFENVDLKKILSDNKTTVSEDNGYSTGVLYGNINLGGSTGENTSRLGTCKINVRDMRVGKLSPIAKLLYVLKLTEPQDYAFSQMYIDSHVRDDNLYFDKFDLSGEAIAFNGTGSLNLNDKNISLVLSARGDRLAGAEPSVFQSLTEGLGKAVLRIDVSGNVYDPTITTKPLPVLEKPLEILGTSSK